MTNLPLARLIAVVLAGVLVGVVAFAVTAAQPMPNYLGPVGIVRMIGDAGFDPWTGMGHGRIYEMADYSATGPTGQVHVVREPGFRTWLGTRHAIPVPVGAAAAWVLLAVVLGARSLRSRRGQGTDHPRPVSETK